VSSGWLQDLSETYRLLHNHPANKKMCSLALFICWITCQERHSILVNGCLNSMPKAYLYKPEGRGFDSRCGHCIFRLTWSFQPHCGPGIDSAYNRNEYQKSSWCGVGKGRPACDSDNFTATCEPTVKKMWEPRHLTSIWASTVCYRDNITFIFLQQLYICVINFVRYLRSGQGTLQAPDLVQLKDKECRCCLWTVYFGRPSKRLVVWNGERSTRTGV
jgi:hypothetical protein